MYSVSLQIDPKLGNLIAIVRAEDGVYLSPFAAFNQAKQMLRLWLEEGIVKVRVLVDSQLMTVAQAKRWSSEEYKSLPKCGTCGTILGGQVYTHRLCDSSLFCSESCADKSYGEEANKINDEEDIEYL
jgi:hypothetical protein